MRGHPCLLEEVRAVHDPDREAGLSAFDAAFTGHLTGSIENKIRTFVYGLSRGLLARGYRGRTTAEAQPPGGLPGGPPSPGWRT